MTVNVAYVSKVTATESFADTLGDSLNVSHTAMDTSLALGAATVPPVTKVAAFAKALVAGAGTIDLTALTGTAGTVDGTGLKVQIFKAINPSTNTNPLIIVPGASSGYNILGATSKVTLNPGEEISWKGYNKAAVPDVAAGVKNIDLSDGVGGTETYNFEIVLG
jgi:hypothetical protein